MKEPSTRAAIGSLRLGRRAGERAVAELPGVQLAVASSAGITAAMWLPVATGAWALVALAAGSLGVLRFLRIRGREPESQLHAIPAWIAIAAAMAAWYAAWSGGLLGGDIGRIAEDEWRPVVIRGVVASSPERRPDTLAMLYGGSDSPAYQSMLDLRVEAVRSAGHWQPVEGTVRTTVGGDITDRLVGDEVIAYGHLRRIAGPTNPGATDMREVYRTRGIAATLRVDTPSQFVLQQPGAWGFARLLSWIGALGERQLVGHVGEDAGALAAALVLGRRQAVDPEMRDRLVETGTVHLLSVSGLHLGIVAGVVAWFMLVSGTSRGWQVLVVVGVCVFYAALTGARPPVLRASMLVAALLIGNWAGKQPSALNSLGLAAVVLLIVNPHNLLQTGAQLSFIAVVTLVVAGRRVLDRLGEDDPLDRLLLASRPWAVRLLVRQWRRSGRFVFVSFWVWAATAPLVWQAYGIVAPVSVVANLLMIGPMMAALISGLFTAALGLLWSPLAVPFGWVCRLCIDVMGSIVGWSAAIPAGHFWLPAPPLWWVAIFYFAILAAAFLSPLWRRMDRHRGKLLVAWMVAWGAIAFPLAARRDSRDDALAVTFVDVGHGTSALVELPGGEVWLYDAGRLGDPAWSAQPIQDVLWSRGLWRLDGIVISHADADHYNAVPGLLERFPVGQIITPPGLLESHQSGLDPVRSAIERWGVDVVETHAGMEVRTADGRVWAHCLHPPADRVAGSDNANSLVLRIDHGGTTVLLPGDLESPGSELLLREQRPAPGGLLMAPHHGSLQESAQPLLDWMRPAVVIVSGSARTLRPEVRESLAWKGSETRLTAADGAVRVEIDSHGVLRVRGWLREGW